MNITTGAGGAAFDWAVTVLLWLAALLQLAVLRDHSLPESRLADASRWVLQVALVGLAGRFTVVLVDVGDLLVPAYSLAPVGLLALALIGLTLDRLRRPHFARRATDAQRPTDVPPSQWPRIYGAGRD